MIIFLKRPAFHSEHFRFSEHEKRKDQNNLKPHYKIAPKGAGLPYQICENTRLAYASARKLLMTGKPDKSSFTIETKRSFFLEISFSYSVRRFPAIMETATGRNDKATARTNITGL